MKKIVRLTEADLARIVRRVIKEQPEFDDDTESMMNHFDENPEQMNVIKSDLREPSLFRIVGADKRTATYLLKNHLKMDGGNAEFIAILNCEGIDLSGIDFCQYPKLKFLNLKGTPNNFEETQEDCYTHMGNGAYDLWGNKFEPNL